MPCSVAVTLYYVRMGTPKKVLAPEIAWMMSSFKPRDRPSITTLFEFNNEGLPGRSEQEKWKMGRGEGVVVSRFADGRQFIESI